MFSIKNTFTFLLIFSFLFSFAQNEAKLYTESESYLNVSNSLDLSYLPEEDKFYSTSDEQIKQYADQKANELFTKLVHLYPHSDNISYYLYYKAYTASDLNLAISDFQRVINLNNHSYYVYLSLIALATHFVNDKNFKLALDHLHRIEKIENVIFICGTEKFTLETTINKLKEMCISTLK
jgi:tetratricopeptide (TPR) repeat protein